MQLKAASALLAGVDALSVISASPSVSSAIPSGTPQPGTDKLSRFKLAVDSRPGNNVTLSSSPVYVYTDGTLGISKNGQEFIGHLDIGPNIVQEGDFTNCTLIITEDHHLQFVDVTSLNDATPGWSTQGSLAYDGQQYGMVCPNDQNRIIWADEDFTCSQGITVNITVQSFGE